MNRQSLVICTILAFLSVTFISCQTKHEHSGNTISNTSCKWTEQRINKWYKEQGWLVGANFVPSSAINQLEMWQSETFDTLRIDKELSWANELGFNTMRVFLHNLLWEQDSTGFIKRIEKYLEIAEEYQIKTMFVLLDDVWYPCPKLGKQPEPKPHVHNSGWVQSPGYKILVDSIKCDNLESYIKGIISHFKNDKRVLIWDLYNEPGNTNGNSYFKLEPKNKEAYSLDLLKKVYKWSRQVNPSQPICIDVWTSVLKELDEMSDIDQFAYKNSDVINFHCYANAKITEEMVKRLSASNRPLFCTEYMARSIESTFQKILPIFKKYNVAAYNWGFVSGKSQTIYPWDSWDKKYSSEPDLWFHDVLHKDGTPYNNNEINFIKNIIKKNEF